MMWSTRSSLTGLSPKGGASRSDKALQTEAAALESPQFVDLSAVISDTFCDISPHQPLRPAFSDLPQTHPRPATMQVGNLRHAQHMPVLGHTRSTRCNVLASPRQSVGARSRQEPIVLTTFTGFRSSLSLGQVSAPRFAARRTASRRPVNSRKVTSMMFERFTEKAIKVVMLAQEEARRLGHNFVGTEQILLGLIGESTGIAAKVWHFSVFPSFILLGA